MMRLRWSRELQLAFPCFFFILKYKQNNNLLIQYCLVDVFNSFSSRCAIVQVSLDKPTIRSCFMEIFMSMWFENVRLSLSFCDKMSDRTRKCLMCDLVAAHFMWPNYNNICLIHFICAM